MATFTVTSGLSPAFVSGDTVTPAKLNSLGTPTIAISAIQTADISDAQITADKLATGAVTGAAGGGKIAASAITGQTQLADPLASGDEFLVHDTSASALRRVAFNAMQPAGSVLQTFMATTDATTSITDIMAIATKPQYAAANVILTQTITPSSSSNRVLVQAMVSGYAATSTVDIVLALFNTTSGDAIAATTAMTDNGYGGQILLTFLHSPNTTSAITYRLAVGPRAATTFYLNKRYNNADSDLGGLHVSNMLIQEIKG